jgi:hypothetical protein
MGRNSRSFDQAGCGRVGGERLNLINATRILHDHFYVNVVSDMCCLARWSGEGVSPHPHPPPLPLAHTRRHTRRHICILS